VSEKRIHSDGPSLVGLLGILFVALKLMGYIDWSWWYVTLPFWGGLAAGLVGILLLAIWAFYTRES